jgi:hypothetical protein
MTIHSQGKVYNSAEEMFADIENDYNNSNKFRSLDVYYFFKRKWDMKHRLWRVPIHWYQRARYGISEEDSWSLAWYLSNIIPRGVRMLRERSMGYPSGMTWEEWEEILMKIEVYLSLYQEDTGTEEHRAQINEALALFRAYYYDLWD